MGIVLYYFLLSYVEIFGDRKMNKFRIWLEKHVLGLPNKKEIECCQCGADLSDSNVTNYQCWSFCDVDCSIKFFENNLSYLKNIKKTISSYNLYSDIVLSNYSNILYILLFSSNN